MKDYWSRFLSQTLDLDEIDQIIVYTDQHRYWLADGLLELGEGMDNAPQVTLLDEVTDEEILEIGQSFSSFEHRTLLAGIFSSYNLSLGSINTLFQPFHAPKGFKGYSLLVQYNIPDQYILDFMIQDIDAMLDREERLKKLMRDGDFTIKSRSGTYLEIESAVQHSYPYHYFQGNHVLLPSCELVASIGHIDGTVALDRTVGSVVNNNELVDPMGPVKQTIDILIEDSIIEDYHAPELLDQRLSQFITKGVTKLDTLSFGLGNPEAAIGTLSVDRLASQTVSLSNPDLSLDFNFSLDTISN